LIAALVELGCTSTTPAQPGEMATDATAPAQGDLGAGCTRFGADASDTTTCIVELACADAGFFVFVCQADDAGAQCGCESSADAGHFDVASNPCADPASLEGAAVSLCGWSIP
jgi:hypothetical protein